MIHTQRRWVREEKRFYALFTNSKDTFIAINEPKTKFTFYFLFITRFWTFLYSKTITSCLCPLLFNCEGENLIGKLLILCFLFSLSFVHLDKHVILAGKNPKTIPTKPHQLIKHIPRWATCINKWNNPMNQTGIQQPNIILSGIWKIIRNSS